ncbi:MAG: PEP-CTERM sorting domain-containing protein [Akkermansia sp.]|nr:PEP-CTERM sorting domain-containing protein [Akkermansia sp.]
MKKTLLTLTLCTATLITFATAAEQTIEFNGGEAFTLTFVLDWKADNGILSKLKDNTTPHDFTLFSLTAGDSTLSLKVQDDEGVPSFDPTTGPVFGGTYTAYLRSVCTCGKEKDVLSKVFDTTSNDNGADSEIAALTVSYGNGTVGYYLRVSYDEYETVYDTSTGVDCTANLSGLMELTYDDALVKSVVYNKGAVDNAKDAAKLNADAIEKERPKPTPSVPEPATATLSLLALAGLAARRRRK